MLTTILSRVSIKQLLRLNVVCALTAVAAAGSLGYLIRDHKAKEEILKAKAETGAFYVSILKQDRASE